MKTNGSLEVAPEALDLAQLKTSRSKAGTLLCGFHTMHPILGTRQKWLSNV